MSLGEERSWAHRKAEGEKRSSEQRECLHVIGDRTLLSLRWGREGKRGREGWWRVVRLNP